MEHRRAAPTSELRAICDSAWGPFRTAELGSKTGGPGHAVGAGRAHLGELAYAGGSIDALVLTDGRVYTTSRPVEVAYARDQLRRLVVGERFRLVHVAFAPSCGRPLLLVLIRVENRSADPLVVDLTETWGVVRTSYSTGEAAAIAETALGPRALADLSAAPRARPPSEPPRVGLALDIRFPVPPGERRQLYFAHVAPPRGEEPAPLVRAWRGDVAGELARTAAASETSEPV